MEEEYVPFPSIEKFPYLCSCRLGMLRPLNPGNVSVFQKSGNIGALINIYSALPSMWMCSELPFL